ncbi:MAG: tyrosine-type recombinase/integrase [Bacteroidia bacterium]|nr:tyrosine-type recombinase/integrase [Bacteroidia bacterium]
MNTKASNTGNKHRILKKLSGELPKDFKEYLAYLRLRPQTIVNNIRYIRRFLEWLDNENLTVEKCTYNDLLAIIKHYRNEKHSVHNINNHLNGIQYYYEYQKLLGNVEHNPAKNLRVKGDIEKVPNDILTQKQIERIFENYQAETPVQKRNKIMISLVVYQGIEREEIYFLEPKDINLEKGTIQVRRNTRLQERILKLNAKQVLPLHEYIKETRSELIKLKKKQTKNYKTDKLFFTIGTSQHIKDSMRELLRELRTEHKYLTSFTQIRMSVISQWIKEKNLREVQYMAGHASIYSTQRYVRANLDELKDELSNYHPLQ